ncbi:MAG: DNA primase [Bacteroidota bacterium]
MRIPPEKVDEIYNATDILDVVGSYVSLKRRGQNHWGLSPFTTEKTPSFAVHPGKNIYKCFSTGKGGNAVNFLMEMEGLSYPEALRSLAKRYNIELPEKEESEEDKARRDEQDSLFIVNEFAAKFFETQLHDTDEGKQIGLSYFKERGLLESTLQQFRLGYAPDSWEAFTESALKKQYKSEFLTELGLSGTSEKTGKLYDRFRGRVMFPIRNQMGKVIGFGGRVLTSEKQMAKYINSPESRVYHKSQVLYGLYLAKQQMRNEDLCILTEGYMDTIMLHQNGIKNVVASSGTALTLDQIRLIRRYTKNVLMIYDGDAAGIKAALRGIDLLVQEQMNARVLVLPDGHDPDSFVQEKGSQAFRTYAKDAAQSFLDFKLGILRGQIDPSDPQQQAGLVRDLAATIALVPDMLQRQLFVQDLANKVKLSEELIAAAVGEATQAKQQEAAREVRREQFREARKKEETQAEVKDLRGFDQLDLANQEKELLRLLLNHHDQALSLQALLGEEETAESESVETVDLPTYLQQELTELQFENPHFEQLKNDLFRMWADQQRIDMAHYFSYPDVAITHLVSELLTIKDAPSENWRSKGIHVPPMDEDLAASVQSALLHYQRRKVAKLLDEVYEELKAPEEDKEDELLNMLIYLQGMRSEISKKLGIIVDGG